jgi:hypothetical protein
MSSFIVNTTTMTKVVLAILQNTDEFHGTMTHRREIVDDPLNEAQLKAGTEIGGKLYAMNQAAVRVRYPDMAKRNEPGMKAPIFAMTDQERAHYPTPMELFASIRCLLYQCHEGEVPKRTLYKELNAVAGELAQRIVQDLPEYQRAPWDD